MAFKDFELKHGLLLCAVFLGLLITICLTPEPRPTVIYHHPLDNMRVVHGPIYNTGGYEPQEDRGEEYRRFLAASVKIRVSGSSGSGTLCYYDPSKNEAWVISCGHLWNGNMSTEEGRNRNVTAQIITWYHNSQKLAEPKQYPATVIFYSNSDGYDLSLLKFTPDWKPDYFPIAPLDYSIQKGQLFHSCGCDGGREVARYEVEIIRVGSSPGQDTRIVRNSPRPGRSGGGLLTNDGFYIGICWGTTDTTSGNGEGIFTSLHSIHQHFKQQGYGWLVEQSAFTVANIPIRDRNTTRTYPRNYIPLPLSRWW